MLQEEISIELQLPTWPSDKVRITPADILNKNKQVKLARLAAILGEVRHDLSQMNASRIAQAIHHIVPGNAGLLVAITFCSSHCPDFDEQGLVESWRIFDKYPKDDNIVDLLIDYVPNAADVIRKVGARAEHPSTDELLNQIAGSPPENSALDVDISAKNVPVPRILQKQERQLPTEFDDDDDGTSPVNPPPKKKLTNPFKRFSLAGTGEQMAQEVADQEFVLDGMALRGQWATLFAAPNIGKTLSVAHGLIESVEAGRIDGDDVYFILADEDGLGLPEKVRILDQYGINSIAPGRNDFDIKSLLPLFRESVKSGTSKNMIVIVDTIKKAVNVQDTRETTLFGREARNFVMNGGTLITIGHTNKQPRPDGTPQYGGTSDMLNDCSCAYIGDVVSDTDGIKRIKFTNIKNRGHVARELYFEYSTEEDISYPELMDSFTRVEPDGGETFVADPGNTEEIIDAIFAAIDDGVTSKGDIVGFCSYYTKASRRTVEDVLKRHTGDDQNRHLWTFTRADRGRHVYSLLGCDVTTEILNSVQYGSETRDEDNFIEDF